ncbi:fructosamine kinase family protein [Roseospira marina]|uniref:Fructosamine kinase family protein n=1 Tax=Roseospira marina TaxID=140057 RepID=A0A5M6I9W0_9PROT|nr:fructosamine kinase family protein [Roseospira marina]KAA5604747.1 fructosamine kinase family protein [Roseospira marina]MBB4313423.1 fructosamine-3-kinase [Roseospira marina]MBB5086585.1 fructosamine-3-kinase [Roseospira marina]
MRESARKLVEQATGHRVTASRPLSGGCVGEVYHVRTAGAPDLVAKIGGAGSALSLEGRMLRYLRDHGVPTPEVLHADDHVLLMTCLEGGDALGPRVQEHAAHVIAALHDHTGPAFGFEYDTVIGGLHQPNPQTERWVPFFRDHRLLFMAKAAAEAGRLPPATLGRVESLAARLDDYLEEPEQPSLLHGDLWTGNVLAHGGRVTGLIDPAIYWGHPEIELAFSTLFGTFNDVFFNRYHDLRPIRPGFFEERRDLYNLYPLLVHVRLFGAGYLGGVDRTLRRMGF